MRASVNPVFFAFAAIFFMRHAPGNIRTAPLLTAFSIDNQTFEVIQWTIRELPDGRRWSLATWQTMCPACGAIHTFEKPTRGFGHWLAPRRCLKCRSRAKAGRITIKPADQFIQNGANPPSTIPRIWVKDGPDPLATARKLTGRLKVGKPAVAPSMPRTAPPKPAKPAAPRPRDHFQD